MKMNHVHHMRKSPRGFSLVELLVVIAIIAGLAAMSYGPIMNQIKAAAKTSATNSGLNIHKALLAFATDNDGLFPNDSTARSGDSGDSAEDCFTQLINAGKMDDEELFWNKENVALGTVKAEKPDLDGVVDPGESAFGYVKGLSTSSKGIYPIAFDASASAGQFDTIVWDGQALVVKIDGSVEFMNIEYGGGKPIEDDGTSKQGPVTQKRGGSDVDLFSEDFLPSGTEVLVPSGS